ncbi:MAG: TRAP transporter large permease [Pseudomonadota bacterium]
MDIAILASLLIFTLLIFAGVPIAFGFLGATVFVVVVKGYNPDFLLPAGFASFNSVTLLTLPFFIAVGFLVTAGSIASRLIDIANSVFGRIHGGLGVVAVVVSCVFGAISGAAASSVIAIGTTMIPQMEKRGYPRGYSAALISSAAVLATMIPPSLAMIMFAFVTGQSVAACFLATVGPAIILATLFSVLNIIMVRRMPSVRPPEPMTLKAVMVDVKNKTNPAIGAILLPVVILGGIYGGIMTPTEAAGVAVFYVMFLSLFVYRDMKLKDVVVALRSSVNSTGTMIVMTFFAALLGRLYTMEQVPLQVSDSLLTLSSNTLVILLLINLLLIITGMVMDELSAILLVTPLLFPVVLELGVHPIQFAAIIGCNLGMGMMTPPMAGIMYIGARVGRVTIDQMFKTSMILIAFGSIPVILITTFWPPLSLTIPRLLGVLH